MGENEYVLAMYDVRGKQDFIFRTNKLQEIVGASWIIRDIFKDYLFPVAEEIAPKGIYRPEEGEKFSSTLMRNRLDDEGYIGEVVYEGGGNFQLIFKSMTDFEQVTFAFTKKVIQEIGTLQVLGTAVKIDSDLTDYKADQKMLYAQHRISEAEESSIAPWSCLPIVQVDRKTSRPFVKYSTSIESIKAKGKLTKESFAKLQKYHKEINRIVEEKDETLSEIERGYFKKNEKILDLIVEEKGKDSKLAVVYIDGNSMGARVERETAEKKDYEGCINALRRLSNKIQKTYVEEGIKAALSDVSEKDGFRIVVYAGDEINFIVKAKDAFKCANNYLNYLKNIKTEPGDIPDSSCVGICVFNSHAPYSDAYRIAEEACESGKQKMKEKHLGCAAFIDYHISQGAVGTSLKAIRGRDNEDGVSRPWLMWCKDENPDVAGVTRFENIEIIKNFLNVAGRSNAKGLASAAKTGSLELKMEINRIYGHLSEKEQANNMELWESVKNIPESDLRKTMYDTVIAFDLWFDEGKNDAEMEGTKNE